MSVVSSWLLSIVGVILLSVLSEFVLPEGQMNKYIKGIFSFVILLVIIMPLPKILGKDFNLSKFFGQEQVLQEDYLYQLNIDKLSALSEDVSKRMKECGYEEVEVSINANVLSENLEIYGVFVDYSRKQFDENNDSYNDEQIQNDLKKILQEFPLLKDVEIKFKN